MTFHEILKKSEKLVVDNSPAILTAIGITGSLTTAYLTGKASFKAAEIIAREKDPKGYRRPEEGPIEIKEKIELVWKLYIPAAGSAVLTIIAIVTANRIGTRRAAAMAAAYSISEKAWGEYKEKVVEKFGEKKAREVRDEVAQDRIRNNPPSKNEVIITGGGTVLCYDTYTGRYFMSTMEELKKAQNNVNHVVLNEGYASLNDFYSWISLNHTPVGEEVGWNSDRLMELTFSTVMSEDDKPCIAISFRVDPIRNFYRAH